MGGFIFDRLFDIFLDRGCVSKRVRPVSLADFFHISKGHLGISKGHLGISKGHLGISKGHLAYQRVT